MFQQGKGCEFSNHQELNDAIDLNELESGFSPSTLKQLASSHSVWLQEVLGRESAPCTPISEL